MQYCQQRSGFHKQTAAPEVIFSKVVIAQQEVIEVTIESSGFDLIAVVTEECSRLIFVHLLQ